MDHNIDLNYRRKIRPLSHFLAYSYGDSYLFLCTLLSNQTRYSFYCCMETKTYIVKIKLQKLRVLLHNVFHSIALLSPSFDWHSQLGSLWERRLYNRFWRVFMMQLKLESYVNCLLFVQKSLSGVYKIKWKQCI